MPSKVCFTSDEERDIVLMFKNKINTTEIGKKYNVSRTPILRVLHNNGIEYHKHGFDLHEEKEICRLYEIHKNQRLVADIVGTSDVSVGRVLRRNGIEIIPSGIVGQKYSLNEHFFDKIDTFNKAYILGLLCADGCLSSNRYYSISLRLQETDKHILEEINSELESNRPIAFIDMKKRKDSYQNQYSLTITNKYMWSVLNNLGITPNKSLTLQYPSCIDDCFHNSFIRGYFDGDGYISKTRNDIKIISSKYFLESMDKIIYRALGFSGHIYDMPYNDVTKTWELTRKADVPIFLDWMYKDDGMCLQRKKKIYLDRFIDNS